MNIKQECPIEQPHHKWDVRCQKLKDSNQNEEKVKYKTQIQMFMQKLGWILDGGQKPNNGIGGWKENFIDIGNCFVEISFPFVKLNGYCFQ